jgi:Putative bacterial sensory transduction regulator
MFLAGRAAVETHLAGKGEAVRAMSQGFSLRTSGAIAVDVLWEGAPGVVHLFTALPFAVAEQRRAQTALAIADLNRQIVVGHFALVPQLVFQVPLLLNHDGTISANVFERALAACRSTAAQFGDQLRRVAVPEPPTPPPAVTVGARRVALTADERHRLDEAVRRDWPPFAPRLAGVLTFDERLQPWWRNHRVIEVQSLLPAPASSLVVVFRPGGACNVLRGHPEVVACMAAADPPAALGDEAQARAYATHCTSWTSEARWGEVIITCFQDIPWRIALTPEERRVVDELRRALESRIHAPRFDRSESGWRLRSWVVSEGRLLERDVLVPSDGRFVKTDAAHGEQLPVPLGTSWGMIDGRLVPVQ